MSERVVIIGDGAMATVCARVLAGNGHRVRMWSAFPDYAEHLRRTRDNARYLPGGTLPDSVEVTAADGEAFDGVTLAVSAVPTEYLRDVWRRLQPHWPGSIAVCSVTKGIENGTLLRPTQVLADVLTGSADGPLPVAALSGPSIARELVAGLPATVVAASADAVLAERVQHMYSCTYLRVYTNPDPIGVELAAAAKNVIAIAAGLLDGMDAGDNAKAALVARGLAEIARLGVAAGGLPETFSGLAGLGDLVTTCISPHGRNRSFGEAVGRGQSPDDAVSGTSSVVEGIATTRSVLDLARRHKVEMPISRAVYRIIFEGQAPKDAVAGLMARELKAEV
jgi:glycerol-3-phosphate dehydrogenase (NAD(P)+)